MTQASIQRCTGISAQHEHANNPFLKFILTRMRCHHSQIMLNHETFIPQTQRMAEVERDFWRLSCPTLSSSRVT